MMMRSSDKAVQATKRRATTGRLLVVTAKSSTSAGSGDRWSATLTLTAAHFLEGMDVAVMTEFGRIIGERRGVVSR